jgi:hypothetical protein
MAEIIIFGPLVSIIGIAAMIAGVRHYMEFK